MNIWLSAKWWLGRDQAPACSIRNYRPPPGSYLLSKIIGTSDYKLLFNHVQHIHVGHWVLVHVER